MADCISGKIAEFRDFIERARDLGFDAHTVPLAVLDIMIDIMSNSYVFGIRDPNIFESLERLAEIDFGSIIAAEYSEN